jgi:hypothetical protein
VLHFVQPCQRLCDVHLVDLVDVLTHSDSR